MMGTEVSNNTIISFLGAPGSGKGTIAQRAVSDLNFQTLSTGNLCRQHISEKTDFGDMLNDYLVKGDLVPDELITNMVEDWLKSAIKLNLPIILDGYPRTANQAKLFYELVSKSFSDYKFLVVEVKLSHDAIIERLSNRLMCKNKKCQQVYSRSMFSPGDELVCNKCGSKLFTRPDDQQAVVKARLSIYEKSHKDLLNYYKSVNQKIELLNVESLDQDQVFEGFKLLLKS